MAEEVAGSGVGAGLKTSQGDGAAQRRRRFTLEEVVLRALDLVGGGPPLVWTTAPLALSKEVPCQAGWTGSPCPLSLRAAGP